MRVAFDHHGEVGLRAARILMAERELQSIGLVDSNPTSDDPRVERVTDLSTYEVLFSDDDVRPGRPVEAALAAGVNCVLWADGDGYHEQYHDAFADIGRVLLIGANLAAGIAPCLASHETARGEETLDVTIAWTEPGSKLRRGEPVAFPDPVGALWAKPRPDSQGYRSLVAPLAGSWAGATARVTSGTDGGVVSRVVGVADLAPHLEALALAGGVLAVDSLAPGVRRPAEAAERFLAVALNAGLDVAAYTLPVVG